VGLLQTHGKGARVVKSKEAIKNLWKQGFFEKPRSTHAVSLRISKDYGAATSNTTAVLRNCTEFLFKDKNGWRQKYRYELTNPTNGNDIEKVARLIVHCKILEVTSELFSDGHYPQAILEAFKAVDNLVKERSGISDMDGTGLMFRVFPREHPILKINGNSTMSEKDEQDGFMHLFAGAMLGIRNPKAHDFIDQDDPIATLQYLAFASVLYRVAEKAEHA